MHLANKVILALKEDTASKVFLSQWRYPLYVKYNVGAEIVSFTDYLNFG